MTAKENPQEQDATKRATSIVASHLSGRAADEPIDWDALLCQHPDLASELSLLRDNWARTEAMLGAARAYVSDCIGGVWETLEQGDELSLPQRAKIGLCLTFAGQSAQRIVDLACGIVGSTALYEKSPLERLRRDMIAVSSHILHQRKTYGAAGRIMLDIDAGPTFF